MMEPVSSRKTAPVNIATSSPQISDLASKSLATVSALPTQQAQYAAADKFLASAQTHADATPAEKLVASTLRACTAGSLKYSTAINAQRAAMHVLASGVSGPVGQLLAQLGLQVEQGAYNQQDQYAVGKPWLNAVKAEGAPLEQRVAEAALQATSVSLKYSTAISAQRQALRMVRDGVSGAPQQAMAAFGDAAMRTAYNQQDQHAVSQQVLPLIKADATAPEATGLASLALAATAKSLKYATAVHAERLALQTVARGVTSDLDLLRAAYGLDAMHGAYNLEDQYALGNAVLDDLAARTATPAVGAVAKAARAALGASLRYSTAVGFQQSVLKSVIAPQSSVEKTLADVGRQLGSFSYSSQDRFALGRGLVNEIKRATSDPRVQALVRYCEQVSGASGASNTQAIAAHDVVFNGITSGNLTVPAIPVPVAGGGSQSAPCITIATVDPDASPEAQRASVEEAIASNRQTLRALRGDEEKASREAAEAQKRLTELEARAKAEAVDAAPLEARFAKWGRVSSLAAPVAVVGTLAGLATAAPLVIAAGAVAGAVFTAAQIIKARVRKTLFQQRMGTNQTSIDALGQKIRVQEANARSASLRKAQEQVERAIDEAQGILDALRMATAPTVDRDATVRQQDDHVMVGGLRIPRNAGAPGRDSAA